MLSFCLLSIGGQFSFLTRLLRPSSFSHLMDLCLLGDCPAQERTMLSVPT